MYKLPDAPPPHAETQELADFAEWTCWNNGTVAEREIVSYLNQIGDNDHNLGCDDDEDANSELTDAVMNEIDRRARACGGGYPFTLERQGTVLRYHPDDSSHRSVLYRYLLLSTRINMKEHRLHSGIDGTLLLEEVAAAALKHYLGYRRARSHVFGTAEGGSFRDKVNRLCSELREGGHFYTRDDAPVRSRDDNLDVVAWVPFSDSLPGQVVIFGQCKTGSNWRDQTAELQPDVFIKKWMRDPVLVDPIRAFCISEAVDRSRWKGLAAEAGIVLDRCRLVDFCTALEPELLERMSRWTSAARNAVNSSLS